MNYFNQKILFVVWAFFFLFPVAGFSQYKDSSMNTKHISARKNVLDEQFDYAIVKYAGLLQKEDNTTVRAEYAFALALSKCYDGAIMNLDKILISGKADKTTLFYISQVLKLMEYDELADVFWEKEESFKIWWIYDKYESFLEKYKCLATINTDNLWTALNRANMLVAQKQYIQSIVLYQELVETYPNEYLPYIGFSALWESLGYNTLAIKYLRQGLAVMGNNKTKFDTDGIYQKHLEKLETDNNYESRVFQSHKLKELGGQKEQNSSENGQFERQFAYFGLTYINKTVSMNAKYGFYTSDKTSFSLGFGFSRYDKTNMYTIASSFCGDIGSIFNAGLSLMGQLSKENYGLGLGLVGGLSIPLSDKKSSIDANLAFYYNFKFQSTNSLDFTGTLSIGYTRYF